MGAWTLAVQELETPKRLGTLSDVLPLLERLEAAFGTRPLAKVLDVSPGMITNWKRRRHAISGDYAQRVIDLHDVLVRALQAMQPEVVMDWLVGREPYLDHARPVDVLVARGASPLIDALRGIKSTGYA
jgi:uncharacterized protein (DUF2384 family)